MMQRFIEQGGNSEVKWVQSGALAPSGLSRNRGSGKGYLPSASGGSLLEPFRPSGAPWVEVLAEVEASSRFREQES